MNAWTELLESMFSKSPEAVSHRSAAHSASAVKGFSSQQEKRVKDRTRALIHGIEAHKKMLRKNAKGLVAHIEAVLSHDWLRRLKGEDSEDILVERAERALVRFAQVLEEQLPLEARALADAVFKIRWHDRPEPIGCWYWKSDSMHRGEVPLLQAGVHAAKVGGELDRDMAAHIGKALVDGLQRQAFDLPNFSFKSGNKQESTLKWEVPVIRMNQQSSPAQMRKLDQSLKDEALVFNFSPELSQLLDKVLDAEIVDDHTSVESDCSKINPETFTLLIDKLAKAMEVEQELIIARIRLLEAQQIQKQSRADPQTIGESGRRIDKLMHLMRAPVAR